MDCEPSTTNQDENRIPENRIITKQRHDFHRAQMLFLTCNHFPFRLACWEFASRKVLTRKNHHPKRIGHLDHSALANEVFQRKRQGDLLIIIPSPEVEHMPESLLKPAADFLLAPLQTNPPNNIIIDLEGVRYFGSSFIQFLLRCHEIVKNRGSELVLAGVNQRIRELLSMTQLDTIWALYDNREEAQAALLD
jgi:anti-sigma B factor antagonist